MTRRENEDHYSATALVRVSPTIISGVIVLYTALPHIQLYSCSQAADTYCFLQSALDSNEELRRALAQLHTTYITEDLIFFLLALSDPYYLLFSKQALRIFFFKFG